MLTSGIWLAVSKLLGIRLYKANIVNPEYGVWIISFVELLLDMDYLWDFVGTLVPQKNDSCILKDPFAGGRGEAEGEGFCGMFLFPLPSLI